MIGAESPHAHESCGMNGFFREHVERFLRNGDILSIRETFVYNSVPMLLWQQQRTPIN